MKSLADFDEWRGAARLLLQNNIAPEDVTWDLRGSGPSLFNEVTQRIESLQTLDKPVTVSKTFVDTARRVICHSDTERFARLYRILWRLQSDPALIGNAVDSDIIWLTKCDKAVRRDRHKMHAFVRFREVGVGRLHREQFAAWFEPTHYITQLSTPFFMRRFPNFDWIIVTPHCTAVWNGDTLKFQPGGKKTDVPSEDAVEDQWKIYFSSIFNPARLKFGAMMAEMPKKYWHNMPETSLIPDLVETARAREALMRASAVTAPNLLSQTLAARAAPRRAAEEVETLEEARLAVQGCRRCPLYSGASQAVFGEGPEDAKLVIIGEQPGDQEDIAGRPFKGPAGKILDAALEEAGILRSEAYVTNAVKHFKFKVRGKRRIHERPSASEIDHCRWWVKREIQFIKPEIIITLGASAARSVFGRSIKLRDIRGELRILPNGVKVIPTIHPSYLLRLPDARNRNAERRAFIRDLKSAKDFLMET